MIADRIRIIREARGMTQAELARKLDITRSSVNAWEMGISVPSTQYIVALAKLFKVSTDYLLDLKSTTQADVTGVSPEDLEMVYKLIEHFRKNNK